MSNKKKSEIEKFVISFGNKFRGKTLLQISEEDGGLTYLDWCLGQPFMDKLSFQETKEAIKKFLAFPEIARELEESLHDDD